MSYPAVVVQDINRSLQYWMIQCPEPEIHQIRNIGRNA
ncbi:hypothetical protein GDI1698 [Gluconacetobacter diazotrophicus PA1 5]|uniref:Uncharacterized protein n=1 Tax=Gluconacetobacter diazotrophicus (strain ATCC 49037 / DSM 5601 / CCUG 37298 / CIP 103539 / LMG 7603 / PAl5) TaxID=272568 RepID=A9HHJ0_GLUDA|nr:hypothetical protein GDI1698 [Gluconacetobacter diazotrophicus PA1 5]